jgi:cell fate (sporulation/competence/biofilm development) regulator YlbF (YheA/YmcA/DUF963 family)
MSVETTGDATEEATTVDELARELGSAIRELPEYQQFEAKQKAVEDSDEAQEKIQEFEQIRQEFMLARQTGQATQEDLQGLQQAQQELHEIPAMAEYLDAQNQLDARLNAVNDAISSELALDFAEQAGGCCQD